ncbi:MAG: CBS domain-containing protein [Armatimonadota bacterium]|nr:CBS domain-containing protein [Armatimonadota bacterium]MDR7450921.1 CBS domain-containing protein [Armatimonadota bacterium]MDR7465843.1 CBS domain-containing protein [Armatimonadota bacterium]MDR7493751.1 CBS domain-containing protein [Armatimonadota bacterium]MDR7498357.1 CBS domain-containing protein [Armatimonadota bacterium]
MVTVADVMTPRPVISAPEDTVAQALLAMRDRGISSVLVSPPGGTLVHGILTMRDIISKIVTYGLDPDAVRVGEVTTWRLITAAPTWSLQEVAAQMARSRIRRLPVVDGGRLVGLVSDTDVFTALVPPLEWQQARLVRKTRAVRRAAQTGPVRTVRDLMSSPVLTVAPDATVREATAKMVRAGVASLLVPEDGDPAAGIVTKRDVVTKVVARGLDVGDVSVGEVASSPVMTIEPEATIPACSSRMAVEGVRRFPVQEGRTIIGIVSDSDILAALAGHRWWGHRGRRWPASQIAADVMQPASETEPFDPEQAVVPELSVWECAARLARGRLRRLPVVQEGRLIGTVSEADILRALEERGGGD